MIVADLLDTLTHTIPDVRGAACKGHPELFDVADRHNPRVTEAKALCAACPVLGDCRRWLTGLPWHRRPCGVVAGRYVAPPRLPPAYVPRPRRPSSRDRAADWLCRYLANGPVLSTQLLSDAAAAGISQTALYAARTTVVNVRLVRVPGVGARHMWELPAATKKPPL